jgi:hypothetical protein
MIKSNDVHLKYLIICLFKYNFQDFQIFVFQIANLKSLIINTKDDINIINERQWKNLIQSSLSYLKIFKFNFGVNNTEYSFEKYFAFIYTIHYEFDLNTKRFSNTSMNNSNTLDQQCNIKSYQYYFSNVKK